MKKGVSAIGGTGRIISMNENNAAFTQRLPNIANPTAIPEKLPREKPHNTLPIVDKVCLTSDQDNCCCAEAISDGPGNLSGEICVGT